MISTSLHKHCCQLQLAYTHPDCKLGDRTLDNTVLSKMTNIFCRSFHLRAKSIPYHDWSTYKFYCRDLIYLARIRRLCFYKPYWSHLDRKAWFLFRLTKVIVPNMLPVHLNANLQTPNKFSSEFSQEVKFFLEIYKIKSLRHSDQHIVSLLTIITLVSSSFWSSQRMQFFYFTQNGQCIYWEAWSWYFCP